MLDLQKLSCNRKIRGGQAVGLACMYEYLKLEIGVEICYESYLFGKCQLHSGWFKTLAFLSTLMRQIQ
jgi:hypothetical protein